MYYDRKGTPITAGDWAQRFGNTAYKRVALTESRNCTVSTVWLGMDHGWGQGEPLIFETMVLGKHDHDSELDGMRYATEEEAREGHEAMVRKWL